jgi:hypothetical protein
MLFFKVMLPPGVDEIQELRAHAADLLWLQLLNKLAVVAISIRNKFTDSKNKKSTITSILLLWCLSSDDAWFACRAWANHVVHSLDRLLRPRRIRVTI